MKADGLKDRQENLAAASANVLPFFHNSLDDVCKSQNLSDVWKMSFLMLISPSSGACSYIAVP